MNENDTETKTCDMFISYSRKNKDAVLPIKDELERAPSNAVSVAMTTFAASIRKRRRSFASNAPHRRNRIRRTNRQTNNAVVVRGMT